MSALSEFYLACRNGDLATVQHLLPDMSDEQKNCLESNAGTALHAATYFGHHAIVKMAEPRAFATIIKTLQMTKHKMKKCVDYFIDLIETMIQIDLHRQMTVLV